MANTVQEKETVEVDSRNGFNTTIFQLHKSIQCKKYNNSGNKEFAFGGTNIKI